MKIDSTFLKLVRPEIEAALTAIGEKYGVKFRAGNASYKPDGSLAVFKLNLNTILADGTVERKEAAAADWRSFAIMFGFPADALGKTLEFQGVNYIIRGLLTKRRKFPILAERATQPGKLVCLTHDAIKGKYVLYAMGCILNNCTLCQDRDKNFMACWNGLRRQNYTNGFIPIGWTYVGMLSGHSLARLLIFSCNGGGL